MNQQHHQTIKTKPDQNYHSPSSSIQNQNQNQVLESTTNDDQNLIHNFNQNFAQIDLPRAFDAHVHLRQIGHLAEWVTPHLAQGGVSTAYVMPNTLPPITTTDMALVYQAQLQALSPTTKFLMTLYLTPDLTPQELRKAKSAGIMGVKSYPRGVTTNSAGGVESYEMYDETFEAMEELGLVLNLHGEVPSNPFDGTCVLNAEARFIPHLQRLHQRFPKLKIVLEHATTRAAIEAVKACGPNVACTITAHHLSLTVDDWAGNGINFCKPVAKFPDDREALREVIRSGHPRFFLGSDSAPHRVKDKLPTLTSCGGGCAAGIYTSPYLLPILACAFESALGPSKTIISPIGLDRLEGFVSRFGRSFYGLPETTDETDQIRLVRTTDDEKEHDGWVKMEKKQEEEMVVIPFWYGKRLGWKIEG